MGKVYKWNESPLRDFLLQIMLLDNDVTDSKFKDDIKNNISFMLSHMGVDNYDMRYLDFNLKEHKKGYVKVMPKNIVSAMWFIGALPPNCNNILKDNFVVFNNKKYKFNKKTKRLTWKKVKK